MKKSIVVGLLLLLATQPFAQTSDISMSLETQMWVSTKTAKVSVTTNAAVQQDQLDKIQSNLKANLQKLVGAQWRIVSLNQQPTSSGLTSIVAVAEARIAQDNLSALYSAAKELSKPGEDYSVSDVDYSPSFSEQQAAIKDMRSKLYDQALAELSSINEVLPGQEYEISRLHFSNMSIQPVSMAVNSTRMMTTGGAGHQNAAAPVSQQLSMSASVSFSAGEDCSQDSGKN